MRQSSCWRAGTEQANTLLYPPPPAAPTHPLASNGANMSIASSLHRHSVMILNTIVAALTPKSHSRPMGMYATAAIGSARTRDRMLEPPGFVGDVGVFVPCRAPLLRIAPQKRRRGGQS